MGGAGGPNPAARPLSAAPTGSGAGGLGRVATAGTVVAALACGAFVVVAVALEAIGGSAANSPVPAWAEGLVPITWSRPARVVWWLSVAAAAGAYRLLLGRAGGRPKRWVTILTVAPFVAFAAGITAGAGWSTWH